MEASEPMLQKIKADLRIFAAREGSVVTTSFVFRMYLLTPGFQFVTARRLQEVVVRIPLIGRLLRRILWWLTCLAFGSELAIGAEFGGGLYIPHPYGIVVGVSKIGRNVAIMQNATIGKRVEESALGTVIGDDVNIGAGAVVLGPLTVGNNAAIGANSVVLADVPAGTLAVGAPARIVTPRAAE